MHSALSNQPLISHSAATSFPSAEARQPSIAIIMAVVALLAAIIALVGNGPSLPIDSHEAFVARTAEEMIARQSWIVPYFNDEPRINKPPLCYWLVIAIDWLNGGDGLISEWEARVPSMIASITLACGAAVLGVMFYGRWVGLLAGLIICTSGGFSAYSHSARPEMVYAALCTLALIAFALAQKYSATQNLLKSTIAAWAGWIAFGFATLSKGPQLPAMLMVGWIAGMIATSQRHQIVKALRPASGLIIFTATWAWWYILIAMQVPNWQELLAAETTSGRIFNYEDFSPWRYLDPYYFYRTFGLVMPWVLLYPLAIAAPWLFKSHFDVRSRQLWWLMLVPILALHISIGRRWYYMLPALAPLAILMAKFALDAGRILIQQRKANLWTMLATLHVIGFAVAIVSYRVFEQAVTEPPMAAIVCVVALAGLAALALMRSNRLVSADQVPQTLMIVLVVGAAFLAAAQVRSSVWDSKRIQQRQFALAVDQAVPADAQLFAWSGDWAREVYYGRRHIHRLAELTALRALLPTPGDTFLLVEEPEDEEILRDLDEVVVTKMNIEGRTRQLVRIAD